MRRSLNSAWLDKIMVSMGRKRDMPRKHEPLKTQLALNRGKAMGLPRPSPPTRQAWKAQDKRQRLNGFF